MKKKKLIWIFPLFAMSLIFMFLITYSCAKDNNTEEVKNPAPDSIILFNPDLTYDTVTDVDGNVYKTIIIGTQTWMAENLKVTKFNDGTDIPLVTDRVEWESLLTPGYCWYKNDEETYKKTFGGLYNWYAVNTGKLCPTGWHVPIDEEWFTLTDFLGGDSVVRDKLKEIGTIHWGDPNFGATNESGFTAIPANGRMYNNFKPYYYYRDYSPINYDCWWTASDPSYSYGVCRFLWNEDSTSRSMLEYPFHDFVPKHYGISIRCVKDQ